MTDAHMTDEVFMATFSTRTSPHRLAFAIATMLAVFVTVLVASPASAGPTFCVESTDGTNSLIVHLDESPNNTTTLSMDENGMLLVNGVVCGTEARPRIAVTEAGEPKDDIVVFDLSRPFQHDDPATPDLDGIFVNIILHQGNDTVRVLGHEFTDIVRLEPDELVVNSGDGIRLLAELDNSSIDLSLDIHMLAGSDTFEMVRQGGAWWNSGPVVVRGGANSDEMRGGPGRQTFLGGQGDDLLRGKGGRDILEGGGGADDIGGGGGGDQISGGGGPDVINGNGGADEIFGNGGADEINGGGGKDIARGGKGADSFRMDDGKRDTVNGNGGRDSCRCDGGDRTKSIATFT